MRTHRAFPALQPWADRVDLAHDLATVEHLTVMRIEPVMRAREPGAFVDLHFSDGERTLTIPLVYLDLAQLDVREADPLVFPHAFAGSIGEAQAAGILERVFADLESRMLRGGFWDEEVLIYRTDRAALFERSRAAGFFGAAPLAVSLPRVGPFVYARRFAAGKHVATYGPAADEAAAFVRASATSCVVADSDEIGRAWYGETVATDAIGSDVDLAIGHGPAPVSAISVLRLDTDSDARAFTIASVLPADVMISFDPDDVPVAGRFTVATSREPFARDRDTLVTAPAVGGSTGRIALVVRPDAQAVPDADTDEAAALALVLGREGFEVSTLASIDALDAFAPDLVHLFGVRPGEYARSVADWAGEHRRPLAVHAYFESPAEGGYWGAMVTPYCFGYSADDRSVSWYLELLGRRAVEVDGVGAATSYAPPAVALTDAERVLRTADVVFVNSERERAVVVALRPNRPTFRVAPLPVLADAGAPIGALVGLEPFVLVHAPVGPHGNQLVLARAAATLGVPMVITGAVEDPAYAERLREFAPESVMLFGELSPAELRSLYQTAPVIADAAWTTRGHARMTAAAERGAAIVVSRSRWLELPNPERWRVDPANVESVARGIGEAWDSAVSREPEIATVSAAAREALTAAGLAIVAGYAKIARGV